MAALIFTGHLNGVAPSGESVYPGATVGEVLDAVFADYPRLRSYIVDDQDRLRKHVLLFVGEQQIPRGDERSYPLTGVDTLYVLQALSGGLRRMS